MNQTIIYDDLPCNTPNVSRSKNSEDNIMDGIFMILLSFACLLCLGYIVKYAPKTKDKCSLVSAIACIAVFFALCGSVMLILM